MATKARLRYVRISPRKTRLVADLVRGLPVDEAEALLQTMPNKAAAILRKVILSAAANAENNDDMSRDELYVKNVMVDKAFALRRLRPRARGRADIRRRPYSHITVEVEEIGMDMNRRGAV